MGAQTTTKLFWKEAKVGGSDNVPPTCCLRPVYVPAHVAAYAEVTGRTESDGAALRRVFGQVG